MCVIVICMILGVKEIQVVRTSPRACKTKQVIVYRCDQCQREYEGKYQKSYLTNRQFHLCSYDCLGNSRRTGGVAVEHQLQSRDMKLWQTRLKRTLKKRYGVENPSSLDWVKQKKVETTRLHYGVDNPQQHSEIKRRSIETYAKNNFDVWISKPERAFGELLCAKFGKENVKIQQLIERKWSIDFYIKSIDTYVQFDGVYWHGLDRPIDIIKASSKSRDQGIHRKWTKDRELDAYMCEQNMRLIRVTDVMFRENADACLQVVMRAS